MDVKKLFSSKIDRRRMLGNLGMMGAGAVLTACGGAIGQKPDPKPDPDPKPTNFDPAILNFALNLEYLEAAFYLAVVGRLNDLPGSGEIILPPDIDGNTNNAANFADEAVRDYAEELAAEELAHVIFLRTALQQAGAPVADRPTLDLSNSFVAAAEAALTGAGIPMDQRPFQASDFNPFAAEPFFLHGSFIFEDVGVTAYKGAARFLTNPDFLEAAAGILAAEAYHSGTIRTTLYGKARAGAYNNLPIFAIVDAISDARDALGNPNEDKDQPINEELVDGDIPTAKDANISLTDANGIAFSRTPRQVAAIVYLNPEVMPGGFFPEGINIPAGLEADFGVLLDPAFPGNLPK